MQPRTRMARALASAALVTGLLAASPTASTAQTTTDPTATPTATATLTPGPSGSPTTSTPTPTGTPGAADASTATPTATVPVASVTPTALATPFVSNVPCATDDPHAPGGVHRDDRRGDDEDNAQGNDHDEFHTGNGRNLMILHNCTDNQLRVRANIQVNTIPGRRVEPLNEAYAEGTCTACQTLSIALQINLYSADRATTVAPQNYAFAINTSCNGCSTVALAIQYNQAVDDPHNVPDDVADTVNQLEAELNSVQQDPDIALPDAEARLNDVLQRFVALGGTLVDQRDEKDD
jgi:hypothetical protein